MRELAREADAEASVYLTGGATAVLLGWRASTIDADILIVPEQDALYRALPRLKEDLQINVEIASPAHFIPELPQWRERSLLIEQIGRVSFLHYDPYSQALAKIERGHAKDLADVAQLLFRRLVEPVRLRELFAAIEPQLHRYPAVDPPSFGRRLDEALRAGR
jgi:Nucleotidyltransferase of unknown function (DUF6036)